MLPIDTSALVARVIAVHPSLDQLARHLAPEGDTPRITRAFLSAFDNYPGRAKTSLLRALLGDNSLVSRAPGAITPDLCRELCAFFECHPCAPLRFGVMEREVVPAHLFALLGAPRGRGLGVIDRLTGFVDGDASPGYWPPSQADLEACRDALRPMVEARRLDVSRATAMVSSGLQSTACGYFFDTGSHGRDAVNLMVYCAQALSDRRGGRIQNLLPLQLADRFGISPRSVPETLAVMDVLALGLAGAINLDALRDDPLGIADIPAGCMTDASWRAILDPHLRRALVTDDVIEWVENSSMPGQYDSGLRFNARRLAGLTPTQRPRFAWLRDYYAAVSAEQILAIYGPWWGELHPELPNAVATSAHRMPEQFAGIGMRDFGNLLALLSASKDPETQKLPSVARFALGEAEPVATGTGRRGSNRQHPTVEASRSPPPLLQMLIGQIGQLPPAPRRKVYVLRPGFTGPLPTDGRVLIPAAVAQCFSNVPPGVMLVGPSKIDWGQDPYDRTLYPELARYDVRELPAASLERTTTEA